MSRKITSQTQFDLLVSFMETNGDLNKPASGPRGKIRNVELWTELTNLLNSNGSGEKKTEERWKKVWSDLKNNTKKKAAKIHREANQTGGGPAHPASLSALEERVLNIMNIRSATGLDNPEIGFEFNLTEEQYVITAEIDTDTQSQPSTFHVQEIQGITSDVPLNVEGTVDEVLRSEVQPALQQEEPSVAQAAHLPYENEPAPGPSRVTARDRQRRTVNVSPPGRLRDRMRRHSSLTDRATEHFLHSDNEWRKYLKEKDERAEQREDRWLNIFEKFTSVLEKFVEKF